MWRFFLCVRVGEANVRKARQHGVGWVGTRRDDVVLDAVLTRQEPLFERGRCKDAVLLLPFSICYIGGVCCYCCSWVGISLLLYYCCCCYYLILPMRITLIYA
uniref:Uncharacterized protein n=1 Tax=Trypanosoma congolense (strain IL3000) TaxID=1068625 RepID=G0UML8_TRYCI|nr:hypothetical protein, unlikely [Trypanosoma congolense IL3000]